MSKPSASGFAAKGIWISTQMRNQPTDCFRLTKVEHAVLYEDDRPFFVRDFFRRMGNIPILYERIKRMSWVKWKQQENGFASAWKKKEKKKLTI